MAWMGGWGWRGGKGGGYRWGWSSPWPGKGPFSHLPPWMRPGWLFGRGSCWRFYGWPWWYSWWNWSPWWYYYPVYYPPYYPYYSYNYWYPYSWIWPRW